MLVNSNNLYEVLDLVMSLGYVVQIKNDFFRRKVFTLFTEDGLRITSFREGDKIELKNGKVLVYPPED